MQDFKRAAASKFGSARARAVAAYALAQVAIAVAGVVRVPITVAALGAEGYGHTYVVSNFLPWFMLAAGAIRSVYRTQISEGLGASGSVRVDQSSATVAPLLASFRWMLMTLGILVLVTYLLYAQTWVAVFPDRESLKGGLVVAIQCALAVLGASALGQLDSLGKTYVASLWLTGLALASIPLALLANALHFGIAGFVFINGLLLMSPYIAAIVTVPRGSVGRLGREKNAQSQMFLAFIIIMAGGQLMTGLDAFVVAALLGPTDAASYGITSRLASVLTLVPAALAPVLASRAAFLRGAASNGVRRDVRSSTRALFALALVAGILFIFLGPYVGYALGRGEVIVNYGLYAAFAVSGVLLALVTPLFSAATGPKSLKMATTASVAGGLVSVAASVLLTLQWGVSGPAWGTSFGLAVQGMVLLILLRTQRVDLDAPSRV